MVFEGVKIRGNFPLTGFSISHSNSHSCLQRHYLQSPPLQQSGTHSSRIPTTHQTRTPVFHRISLRVRVNDLQHVRLLKELDTFLEVVSFPLCEEVKLARSHVKQLLEFLSGQVLLQRNKRVVLDTQAILSTSCCIAIFGCLATDVPMVTIWQVFR